MKKCQTLQNHDSERTTYYNILQNFCVVFFVRIAFCNKTCGLHLKRKGLFV